MIFEHVKWFKTLILITSSWKEVTTTSSWGWNLVLVHSSRFDLNGPVSNDPENNKLKLNRTTSTISTYIGRTKVILVEPSYCILADLIHMNRSCSNSSLGGMTPAKTSRSRSRLHINHSMPCAQHSRLLDDIQQILQVSRCGAMRSLCSFVEYPSLMLSSRPVAIPFCKHKFVSVSFLSTTFFSASRPSRPAWREGPEMLQSHTAKVLRRRWAPEEMCIQIYIYIYRYCTYNLDSFCIINCCYKDCSKGKTLCFIGWFQISTTCSACWPNKDVFNSTTYSHLFWVLSLVLLLALSSRLGHEQSGSKAFLG